jgi:hypothetical protein
MKRTSLSLAALAIAVACACAPRADPEDLPVRRGDFRTITSADLAGATQLNLQDFVVATHPQWLRDPSGRIAAVTVFLDDTRLGGLSTLAGISLNTVGLVRYYEASAAQQKFNVVKIGPVIHVLTR